MADDYAELDSSSKWSPGRTKALMAMVAIITAIAIWLVPVDDKQAPTSLPSLPSEPQSTEKQPLPSATHTSEALELALPPPPGGIATVTNGGDGARAFIYKLRSNGATPDAEVVFTEAERMQKQGNLLDAYLLYRFAARQGQPQAALILGTQADPAYHTAASSYLPEAEPAQAYKWYSMAAAADNQEATLRLQALHDRVQQDAAAGDEQARRLLLQWQ